MKKVLFISVLTVLFTVNTIAQDKTADVKKLIELMQSDKMISGMLNSMTAAFSQTPELQNVFSSEFIVEEMKALMKKMEEEMVSIYSKHFTHEEIKELVKFYQSPAGKKFIEKTPELQNDMMSVMMSKYMPEFQEKLMQKLMNE
jgi:hypothetical protein